MGNIATKLETKMNNQTPPPPAGYPHPMQPFLGAFNTPPPSPPVSAQGYIGIGTAAGGYAAPSPPASSQRPAYHPFPNDLMLGSRLVNRNEISVSTEICHRHAMNPTRVATIAKRCLDGAHFPPLVLFQRPDGGLHLVDGLHRLAAFDQIGVKIISAIVIDDLGQALVAGIRQNLPKDGKLRSGPDAMKCLFLLATALGRKITPPEAASLGILFDENHEVLSPATLKLLTSIHSYAFPSSAQTGVKAVHKNSVTTKKKAA